MSQFTPTTRTIEPPATPDFLAGAALEALARPLGGRRSWSLLRTLVLGIPSLGIWPILMWSRRLRQSATAEQQQLVHLSRWIALNTQHPQAPALERDAERVGQGGLFRILSLICVGAMFISIGRTLVYYVPNWYFPRVVAQLLDGTYGFVRSGRHYSLAFFGRSAIFNTWNLGLICAYACHWIALQGHAIRVRRFIWQFNQIAASEGLSPVAQPGFDTGIRFWWLAAAAAMAAWGGAFWAVPMMLAGATQRRYIVGSSTRVRAAMAHRLRAMMMQRRPQMQVPMPVWLRNLCSNSMCRGRVPDEASYCPRCGTRLARQNQVA